MQLPETSRLTVSTLGRCDFPSPFNERGTPFVDENSRVLLCSDHRDLLPFLESGTIPPSFESAGPRARIFHDPARLTCGIVTCGGLCPGINDVIRSIVRTATDGYGVSRVLGFRYGYAGLASTGRYEPLALTPEVVDHIHKQGGTLLGSSRGPQSPVDMVDTLVARNVGLLFAIGGDGTLRGAAALCAEVARRRLPIGIIGIPKTIDNDVDWVQRTFGFVTAVEEARPAIEAAHTEALGAWNGIGLVKLMGRHSGFIAALASLSNADVNFCLVPEVPFTLEGQRGFLAALEHRLSRKHHAVVVVAEGAGQDLTCGAATRRRDASGNRRLPDIGLFLRDAIVKYFESRSIDTTIKYIDPSYTIRSLPANSLDSAYCLILGQHAVHAGMAGRTNLVVGYWNQRFTHMPIALATASRKQLDRAGEEWQRVLQSTGQPAVMVSHAKDAS